MEYESYLAHHGVKGMKWGIRRYQDKNGRYTAAGRSRYIADRTRGIDKDIQRFQEGRKGLEAARSQVVAKYGEKRARGIDKDIKRMDDSVYGLGLAKEQLSAKYGAKYDKKMNKQLGRPAPAPISPKFDADRARYVTDRTRGIDKDIQRLKESRKGLEAARSKVASKYGEERARGIDKDIRRIDESVYGLEMAKKKLSEKYSAKYNKKMNKKSLNSSDVKRRANRGKSYIDAMM